MQMLTCSVVFSGLVSDAMNSQQGKSSKKRKAVPSDDDDANLMFIELTSLQEAARLNLLAASRKDCEDRWYEELSTLLEAARSKVELLYGDSPELLTEQLSTLGVALVLMSEDDTPALQQLCGANMATTFDSVLPSDIQTSMRAGEFGPFSRWWRDSRYKDTRLWGQNPGMPNWAPLGVKADLSPFTCPITGTVHTRNVLTAKNNVQLWQSLCENEPRLHPDRWFVGPLRGIGGSGRVQVSEDGVKVRWNTRYKPTALHYDGQLGATEGVEAHRIQAMYTADRGPVRLFVVPGSNSPRVRAILQAWTGLVGTPTFSKHSAIFRAHPRLWHLLHRFGVALPAAGLLMWVANVWHFEGVEQPTTFSALAPVRVQMTAADDQYDPNATAAATARSVVFRVYCGLVAVPASVPVEHLVRLAFLRQRGWCMEPFTSINKAHPLFVNEKNAINYNEYTATEQLADAFHTLPTDQASMRESLRSDPKFGYWWYGLTAADVAM